MRPKKPARNTREYINRKNNNTIFPYTYLRAACTKPDDFCYGDALQRQYPTFQISNKSRKAFPRYS